MISIIKKSFQKIYMYNQNHWRWGLLFLKSSPDDSNAPPRFNEAIIN